MSSVHIIHMLKRLLTTVKIDFRNLVRKKYLQDNLFFCDLSSLRQNLILCCVGEALLKFYVFCYEVNKAECYYMEVLDGR